MGETRKKLDISKVIEVSHMENGVKSEPCHDLRKSFGWDDAFFSGEGVLDSEDFLKTLNFCEEPEQTYRASVRSSIAWDTALFTNPGVLDSEELCLVNGGIKESELQVLPGVKEELWTSADTNSTVDRRSFSLASLELDLFDDMRSPLSQSTSLATLNLKSSSGVAKMKNIRCSNEFDGPSRRRIKLAQAGGSSSTINPRKPEKTRLETSCIRQAKNVVRSGERGGSVSLSETRKILHDANTTPLACTKKICVGRYDTKLGNQISEAGHRNSMTVSRRRLQDSSGLVQKSCSIDLTFRSQNPSRKRSETQMSSSGLAFSKTLSRYPNEKNESVNRSQSRYMTPKLTSSMSRASSINSWSSKSIKSLKRNPFPLASHENKTRVGTSTTPDKDQRNSKPSGLRKPSPKLDFFDTETFIIPTPTKESEFQSDARAANSRYRNESPPRHSFTFGYPLSDSKLQENGPKKKSAFSNITRVFKSRVENKGVLKNNKEGTKSEGKVQTRAKTQCSVNYRDASTNYFDKKRRVAHDENKENVPNFENQVEALSKQMEAVGIKAKKKVPIRPF